MLTALLVAAAFASPLVTGNGFGYAVIEADTGVVTKLYAHPYRFMRKREDSADGVSTANLVRRAFWSKIGAGPASYARESHVIDVRGAGGTARFVEPFGLAHNVLVTASSGGSLTIAWQHPVKAKRVLDGATIYGFAGVTEQVAQVAMPGGAALIVLESEADASAALRDFEVWRGSRSPSELVEAELAAHEAWRVPPKVTDAKELALWRQSETILRMAQIREPNRDGRRNQGLINASLPNGDRFIPWVRDAPYQISTVRYFGDGTEDADTSGQPYQNVDFALARTYVKLGKSALEDAILRTITTRALADHGFTPEMFVSNANETYKGIVGSPAGAVPMVGYDPGVLMLYLSERAAAR